jgi:hypothetical protein
MKIHDIHKSIKNPRINIAVLEDFAKRGIIEIPRGHRRNKSLDMLDVNDPIPVWDFGAYQAKTKIDL